MLRIEEITGDLSLEFGKLIREHNITKANLIDIKYSGSNNFGYLGTRRFEGTPMIHTHDSTCFGSSALIIWEDCEHVI
jgi:hypothetical protein